MVGFIGERAKRRRRKIIIFFTSILFFLFFYYLWPFLKLSDVKPTDNLLPSEEEIISPDIKNTIEELELKVFDKEQKIIFRNRQIEELKNQINIIVLENKNLLQSSQDLNKIISSSVNDKDLIKDKNKLIENIKKNNLLEQKKLKDKIIELKIANEDLLKEIEIFKSENYSINKKFKSIFSKNLKLKDLNDKNNKKIIELEDIIEEQNLIIQLLKDKTPHG